MSCNVILSCSLCTYRICYTVVYFIYFPILRTKQNHHHFHSIFYRPDPRHVYEFHQNLIIAKILLRNPYLAPTVSVILLESWNGIGPLTFVNICIYQSSANGQIFHSWMSVFGYSMAQPTMLFSLFGHRCAFYFFVTFLENANKSACFE